MRTERLLAQIGVPLEEVDTPSLIIDLEVFERNLRRLPTSLSGAPIHVRPHAKTHKSVDIARKQMACGAIGICCQKVSEAEAMVDGGISDVLITNQVVGAPKLERLAQLRRKANVSVCVDNIANVQSLNSACERAGVNLDVLVELDVGQSRCGVPFAEVAAQLAQGILGTSNLRFGGIQAYNGSAQHVRSPLARKKLVARACEAINSMLEALSALRISCPKITGGGTGTYIFESSSKVYTEVQPGSYIFMDADYSRNYLSPDETIFEQSLFVYTSIMSTPVPGRVVVDAGLKAVSTDSGMPLIKDIPSAKYVRASDEHGEIRPRISDRLDLGKKLMLIPGHCDPTVNLYDNYLCVRDGLIEAIWPVTARGAVH